jgi:glycosyltransferase involved in cell wall biosynthesis
MECLRCDRLAAADAVAPAARAGSQDIVFVGQIIREKGPDLLVDAFGGLASLYPASRVLISGRLSDLEADGWARSLRDRVARDPNLAGRVVFTGFVENVPALLENRLVLVAPTIIEEGLGLVVMEAKAAGIPAIVFPAGGLPEMIEDGVDGFVCRETTAAALAGALSIYLNDPLPRRGTDRRPGSHSRDSESVTSPRDVWLHAGAVTGDLPAALRRPNSLKIVSSTGSIMPACLRRITVSQRFELLPAGRVGQCRARDRRVVRACAADD